MADLDILISKFLYKPPSTLFQEPHILFWVKRFTGHRGMMKNTCDITFVDIVYSLISSHLTFVQAHGKPHGEVSRQGIR
jgi:hypothetical protein